MGWFDTFVSWLPPSFLGPTAVTNRALLYAIGRQMDDLEAAIDDNQNQIFIQLATWALSTYESEFAIHLVDGGTDAERRSNILAKDRSGQGATPSALQNVLSAYGYNTQIIEDFANYAFTINFTDYRGIPSNMGDLQLLLQSMIPAHLAVSYEYHFLIWSELDNLALSWVDFDDLNLTWAELPTWNPNQPIVRESLGLTMSEQ